MSMLRLLAQIINFSNSSSLKFFITTVLILISISFFFASSIPEITFSKFPNLVILLYFFELIVSSDTLILLIPLSFNSFANFFNREPFVVKVISFKFV